MSAGKSAIDYVIDEDAGATRSMDLPHLDGARHVHRDYDPGDYADYETFSGGMSYVPVSGAWKGEAVGVGFTGYYDSDGALWAESFSVVGGGGGTISVRAGGADILLSLALNDIGASIGVLGVEAVGNSHANRLTGGAKGDTLRGLGGDDVLKGGGGADLLKGGSGDDLLRGGSGPDDLWGNRGADVFEFRSIRDSPARPAQRDVIHDFSGADLIDLRAIDADSHRAGNNAFRFIGSESFDHHAGELRYAGGLVKGDVNGDGQADFSIEIANDARLHGYDFIL
ncbi:MAG: M10 family metallopeptidase C-terminal domain-containing protein [Amaricoccus sp.]